MIIIDEIDVDVEFEAFRSRYGTQSFQSFGSDGKWQFHFKKQVPGYSKIVLF